MRFMMLMIRKDTRRPSRRYARRKAVAAMMKYNESLQKAGVLLALDGLHHRPWSARFFLWREASVTDGPFTGRRRLSVGIG